MQYDNVGEPIKSERESRTISARHESAAGALCADDGTGVCKDCGVGLEVCDVCKGTGYHREGCEELDDTAAVWVVGRSMGPSRFSTADGAVSELLRQHALLVKVLGALADAVTFRIDDARSRLLDEARVVLGDARALSAQAAFAVLT